jgi:L-ascorbate 6-phosphate lactonase
VATQITWLGQAGVAIRAEDGSTCLIDPYLSDALSVEGHRRVPPIPLDPAATRIDVVATSHWHPDHLDRATCVEFFGVNPAITFLGPPANASRLRSWGIPEASIRALDRGDLIRVGPFSVQACFARHDVPGWIAEDAISFVVEVDDLRIFHSGDTDYDSRLLAIRQLGPLDIGFFSMNGTGGNMNALEAATLAAQLAPSIAIPMHFGMWAPEGYAPERGMPWTSPTLDPNSFIDRYAQLGDGLSRILAVGETVDLPPDRRSEQSTA